MRCLLSRSASPTDGDAAPVIAEMVGAAKRRKVAGEEFRCNSIPWLAVEWSDALAAEGRNSRHEDAEAMLLEAT